MILYLDTSALVPLLVSEPTTAACGELWDSADSVTSTRLAYVEAAAALAQAERMNRLTRREARDSRMILDELWDAVDVIELDAALMAMSAELASAHALRGYDAVHCAAAVTVNGPEVVAASGDRRLIAAWAAEGLAVTDTNLA